VGQRIDLVADGFLFDMDGTLVDSTAVVEALWTEFGEEYGIDPADLIDFSHGRQTIDTLNQFMPDRSGEERIAIAQAIAAAEVRRIEGITEIAGAAALIDALVETKARVALVTSADRELAQSRMRASGIRMPDVLVTAEDVDLGKPDPEGYLRAAERLGVPIETCVAFEDAAAGLTAAVASGAHVVVVGGHNSPVAAGLDRMPDFMGLSVTSEADGVHIRG
jgi:mannitol-1-/sugar-/sorbitol-6-phosphatase